MRSPSGFFYVGMKYYSEGYDPALHAPCTVTRISTDEIYGHWHGQSDISLLGYDDEFDRDRVTKIIEEEIEATECEDWS